MRYQTWKRLNELTHGVLTTVLDTILNNEPIAPVVAQPHLVAMDRRLLFIINMVKSCIKEKGSGYVLVKDKGSEVS